MKKHGFDLVPHRQRMNDEALDEEVKDDKARCVCRHDPGTRA